VFDPVTFEPWLRSGAFIGSVALLAFAEHRWPRRTHRPLKRAAANVGLLLTNTVVVRLLSSASLVGVAVGIDAMNWGLFALIDAPVLLETLIAVLLLDASMYLQHRLFHRISWLWRLHAVHHSDTSFDLTTGIRFHPGEAVTSFAMKAAAVVILGADAWAVLIFEVLLSTASLFTHTNVQISKGLESILRRLVVTPEMHRTHHSVARDEHNTNFGFLLVWWDRLFHSYRSASRVDPASMEIGLRDYRSPEAQAFGRLLRQPLTPITPSND
jgi:sterol desaturase/sphingolipid hydroxylase (fatty acid hydroxylase superfamily)